MQRTALHSALRPDWEFIIRTIKENRCVLLLGPGLPRTMTGERFHHAFVKSLDIPHNELIASYYEGDELFLFPDATKKTRLTYLMKDFYEQPFQEKPYQIISQLPLKMIINASPDKFLAKTMGPDHCQEAVFHKGFPDSALPTPSIEKPLIYNLVGEVKQEESLLLTHDDLYQFIESILARQNLPRLVLDELFAAKSLIFLGLSFHKWYVQLLLRLLRVHDPNSGFVRYATDEKQNAETISICTDQFKIEFVNYDIDGFLTELERRCEEKGLLIQRSNEDAAEKSDRDRVVQYVKEDLLKESLELMLDHFDRRGMKEESSEVIGLQARLNRLEKRWRSGVIDERDYDLGRNRIREAILELVNEME